MTSGLIRPVHIGNLEHFLNTSGDAAGDARPALMSSAVWGQALSDYPPPQCRCRSRARASLRNRHQGPSSMGSEDEAEQSSLIGPSGSSTFRLSTNAMSLAGSCFSSESAPRPFQYGIRGRGGTIFTAALPSVARQVQADIRTHLIHRPARDIFPPLGGALVFSPIGFDPEQFSCCCRGLLAGPPELGAVNPDAVHDHGQPASQCHDCLFHPAAPGDLHGPSLEPGPFF